MVRPNRRRGEDDGRVLEVGDEIALEPAQETLLLVARQRRVRPALFPVPDGGLRAARARLRGAVEVHGPGDEGVCRQREQQQTRRRARPYQFKPTPAQHFTQTL